MTEISDVVCKYKQQMLQELEITSLASQIKPDGKVNRQFLTYVTSDVRRLHNFLRDCRLIKSSQKCLKCSNLMSLSAGNRTTDRFMWRCMKSVDGKTCDAKMSIRKDSWFSASRMTMKEILTLTYELLHGTPTKDIINEMTLSSRTVADWNTFVKETLVHYLDENSQPIGGEGVVVEVDETKFGKRRYTRGRFVEGKWVLGGIERGTKGRVFLVPVLDRQSEALTRLLKKWILPGTTVITNCWSAYDKLDEDDYRYLTVNYNFNFVDPTTAPYTNTIKNVWRHVKASLPTYNRQRDFSMYIADFLFDRLIRDTEQDKFCKFLEIICNTDWTKPTYEDSRQT